MIIELVLQKMIDGIFQIERKKFLYKVIGRNRIYMKFKGRNIGGKRFIQGVGVKGEGELRNGIVKIQDVWKQI